MPRSLAFGLNVDWSQPYSRRSDVSVGVIYLVILNLPREERFKWENVILAGVIPDMEKMPKSINSFLKPLADELQVLWKGIRLHSSLSSIPFLFHGAILLAASDICFKSFPGSVKTERDFSGFDRDQWQPRCNELHRCHADMVRKTASKTTHENAMDVVLVCFWN